MFGWVSAEMLRASRSKRSRNSGSIARSGGRTLTATVRSSRVSLAAIDLSHTARANRRDDFVRSEPRARLEVHEVRGL